MSKRRGFLAAGLCFCASVLGWSPGSEAATNKVTICHKSSGKYRQLVVAGPALKAHIGHGDCVVDDGVPCTVDSCNPSLGCVHVPNNSQCDDGNACTIDTCNPATGCLHGPNPCGDGVVCPNEACDDGNTNACDGCSPVCAPEFCGDGVVCSPEECDGGGGETATCNADCTTSRCGDGIRNATAGEQCDDGNTVSGDGCGATCQNEAGGIPNDNCATPIAVGDGTRTYSNLGATTDGPDEPATCDFLGNTNVDADIWFCYTATCTGTAVVSLCGSDYDTKLAVYNGCACPTATPLACNDDGCGTGTGNIQSRIEFPATTGLSYLVRVGGYLGEQGDGRLTIGCNVDACSDGTGDCFTAHEAPGCSDAACCASTCGLDQFCCDVTWDETCAGEAEGVCGGSFPACGPGSGACDVPDNTPGCDNVGCCNTVCTVDPFCCLGEWDETCVDEAALMCFLNCGPGAGDCHSAHATPGCESQTCCETVCAADPFCCDTEWDQTCVDAAAVCP